MKILFVIDTIYTSNNGTSISAQRFACELRKRGHQVRALCGDKPKNGPEKHITDEDYCTGIFHFPIFQPLCEKHDFFYGNADKAIIRKACDWADIVHVYTPFFLSNATITYCQQIGKPVTAAFHVQPENITSSFGLGKVKWINNMIYKIFHHVTYRRIRHIHAPSPFLAKTLLQKGYTNKMHVISNGIHNEFIRAGEGKTGGFSLRKCTGELGHDENGIIKIMMIGRLSREKRQDVIINALQYSKYGDRIQLVFAGKGPEFENYVQLAQSLKHQPKFVFLNREQLIQELLTTDLYIHASDMEIEAISCIEAFATGLVPVIADSENSATQQFALDERSLFKAGDPKDLARAIDYWLDRPKERLFMEKKYAGSARKYSLSNSVRLFEYMLREEIADNEHHLPFNENTHSSNRTADFSAAKCTDDRLNRRIA